MYIIFDLLLVKVNDRKTLISIIEILINFFKVKLF
jgi:hypothetical protein